MRNAVTYIENSEKGFDYYIYDNDYYFKETSYSIRLKISPNLIENYISTYNQVNLTFGLEYSLPITSQFDIFSKDNLNTIPPSKAQYFLELNKGFYMESDECINGSNIVGNHISYTLSSSINIFGEQNSLYSFTKKYQKTTEYIYLTAKYYFKINDSFKENIENYKNITMNFYMSIGGSAS